MFIIRVMADTPFEPSYLHDTSVCSDWYHPTATATTSNDCAANCQLPADLLTAFLLSVQLSIALAITRKYTSCRSQSTSSVESCFSSAITAVRIVTFVFSRLAVKLPKRDDLSALAFRNRSR